MTREKSTIRCPSQSCLAWSLSIIAATGLQGLTPGWGRPGAQETLFIVNMYYSWLTGRDMRRMDIMGEHEDIGRGGVPRINVNPETSGGYNDPSSAGRWSLRELGF